MWPAFSISEPGKPACGPHRWLVRRLRAKQAPAREPKQDVRLVERRGPVPERPPHPPQATGQRQTGRRRPPRCQGKLRPERRRSDRSRSRNHNERLARQHVFARAAVRGGTTFVRWPLPLSLWRVRRRRLPRSPNPPGLKTVSETGSLPRWPPVHRQGLRLLPSRVRCCAACRGDAYHVDRAMVLP